MSAPPTDALGNARSTSPVADRINNTENYSFDEVANYLGGQAQTGPAVTPEQSAALANGAAVIDGVAVPPDLAALPSTPRDAAIALANAELSVDLQVQRHEIDTLTANELDHIDGQLAAAKSHRADALSRYEDAAKVSFDQLGVPQQASGYDIEQLANDFRTANDQVAQLEDERAAIERAQALPDAIERGFMAEDMYNVQSHLQGSHMARMTDAQLPADLKTSDMINPETGFVTGIYENHRNGTVNLVARGTDFGLSTDEFAKDMVANGGQGLGLTTAQYDQARTLGGRFRP
ncbi:MAG: hypothetical protein ACR2RA_23025 [Geminicoccaceae bacterium]